MKNESHTASEPDSGKVSAVDPKELMRLREAVRKNVVEPMQERAAEQKDALAKARARYVR